MRLFLILFLLIALPAHAQDGMGDMETRLKLSKEIHDLKPVKPRIDKTIDSISKKLKESDQRSFAATVKRILNYKIIETSSINAMAEIYTAAELAAMLEYYKKPEAISAAEKQEEYQEKVSPEITKMLDKALMEMRTGRSGG